MGDADFPVPATVIAPCSVAGRDADADAVDEAFAPVFEGDADGAVAAPMERDVLAVAEVLLPPFMDSGGSCDGSPRPGFHRRDDVSVRDNRKGRC